MPMSSPTVLRTPRSFKRHRLRTVLGHPCVSNTFDQAQVADTLWKVELGSGMGKKHSGIVADYVFAQVVEKPFRQASDELGILLWLRFRDNVFRVVKDPLSPQAVRNRLTSLAAPLCQI